MVDSPIVLESALSTHAVAHTAGYSVQQVRDLERLGTIPPAHRSANGYRRFDTTHVVALRAYRRLAQAVGPVVARRLMQELQLLPYDEAVARVVALHTELARARDEAVAALQALGAIAAEADTDDPGGPADVMTITELAEALGVRSSTLRFWEREGLVDPHRDGPLKARVYPLEAVRDARIVTALRAGGHRIPAVRAVMTSLHSVEGMGDARKALEGRLRKIAAQSAALLRAGADLADLLEPGDARPTY